MLCHHLNCAAPRHQSVPCLPACAAFLQAVFDLPGRMQAALEEDALGAAVGFYSEALPLLRKYGHRGAFRGIAAEADAAARQVSMPLLCRAMQLV